MHQEHESLATLQTNHPAEDTQTDVVQIIYQTVFDSVMGQRLTPGTKLSESALCKLFNVGRTSVQKALQKLAHDHIVELRANRSAVVAMPSPEETRYIFEARHTLEASIIQLAVKNATKNDFKRLRKHLKNEHDVMHSHAQRDWAKLASAFHFEIAKTAHNPILLRYMSELLSRCSLIVALYEPSGHATCEHDEHELIVDLIEQGNATKAIEEMEKHLHTLEEHIHLQHEESSHDLAQMLGIQMV